MSVISSETSCDMNHQVRGCIDVDGTAAHLWMGFLFQGLDKPGHHEWKLVQIPSNLMPILYPLSHKETSYPSVSDIWHFYRETHDCRQFIFALNSIFYSYSSLSLYLFHENKSLNTYKEAYWKIKYLINYRNKRFSHCATSFKMRGCSNSIWFGISSNKKAISFHCYLIGQDDVKGICNYLWDLLCLTLVFTF